MKNQFLFFVAIGLLPALPVFGHSEELDFHYWYSDTLPLPDGWTHYKLNKGALDSVWKGGAYFDSMEDWLLSPVFDASIRSVTLYIATSAAEATRTMYLYPIRNGVADETGIALQPTANQVYVAQSVLLGGCEANQFLLKIVGSGNKGNWGMERIIVRHGDESTDDETEPPRSWSVAEIVRKHGCREADFSILQYVAAEVNTPWRNGVTIDGFHAFLANAACSKINLANSSVPKNAGLYALDEAEGQGMIRTLALKCSRDKEMCLMLPVALDAKRRIARLSVAYRVWAPKETDASILSFSYRVLDDLTQMNAGESGWIVLPSSGGSSGMRSFEVPTASLRNWKFVSFRWSLPQEANLPAIGISDVRISAELEPSGFAVFMR